MDKNIDKKAYVIKKTIIARGKKQHVFLTDGQSEVLEIASINIAKKLVDVLNENSDNFCSYKLITIGK
jgi:hypothetical protein